MRGIVFFLSVFFFSTVSAQERHLLVVDQDEKPASFVHAMNSRTGHIFLTDKDGVLLLGDYLDARDTLVFQSAFYQQLRYTGAELASMAIIVLPTKDQDMESVSVYPKACFITSLLRFGKQQ